MDLGQFWYDWTGLPFVFAMWVARRKSTQKVSTKRCLTCSGSRDCQRGRDRSPKKLLVWVSDAIRAHNYLTKNLHYHLTSAERSGLKLFSELAAQHNLVKPNVDIVYPRLRHCLIKQWLVTD
jgi:chorismate dehydratase